MALPFFLVPLPTEMKYLQIILTFSAFAVLTFTACGSDGRDATLVFDSITVEKNVNIEDSKDAPQCHVRLEILQARNASNENGRLVNEAIVKKIFDMEQLSPKAAADSFANTYTRDYRKNLAPLYREDRADSDKHPWYEYRYIVTTEVNNDCHGITNYLITLDYYEGGAHGITQLLTLNFNNHSGRQMSLVDIYGPGYEQKLCDHLLNALLKKTGDKNLNELHHRGYLYSMDMFVSENYIIGDDKVTFIYNPYEIAPYSEGTIKLDIKRQID